jgi:hypothetical protein
MSKHINMTGHYHVAGRERQGEGILQSSQKGAFAQQRHEARLQALEAQAGPPAWETTPPNLGLPEKPKPRTRSKTRRPGNTKKTQSRKATRKTAPKRKSATRPKSRKAAPKRTGKRAAKAVRSSARRSRTTSSR